jgi:hypothetical protein
MTGNFSTSIQKIVNNTAFRIILKQNKEERSSLFAFNLTKNFTHEIRSVFRYKDTAILHCTR